MKVLHLLSSSSFSGAENVAITIINKLGDKYTSVYCSPYGDIKNTLKEKEIGYIALNKMSFKEIRKAIKSFKPDIIHAHDYRASCYASLFSKKHKIIAHIHGNREEMHKRNLKTILFKQLSKRFHKIIWVSDSCLNDYYYKDKVKDKSIVLYNIVDKQSIINKAKKEMIKKEYDLIFLGRLIELKDPLRFIEIIKELKNLKVAIVGDGELKEQVVNKVKEYKLNNVDIYGFINNPYPILNSSKVLIMTSKREGTPMVALEAMALSKPIVSTPIDGLKKIIKNNYNGFLCKTNKEFINSINKLQDKKYYKEIQKNINDNFIKINNEEKYINMVKESYK